MKEKEEKTISENIVDSVVDLQHYTAIMSIFEDFYKERMSDDDKKEFVSELIKESGITLKQLNDDIETGVNNGYSVEFQLKALKVIFKNNDQ